MSYSKEKTYWYLTEEGWICGDSHYDTGGIHEKAVPKIFVAEYLYSENYSSPFDKNPIKKTVCLKVLDEDKHNRLIKKYGECPKYI